MSLHKLGGGKSKLTQPKNILVLVLVVAVVSIASMLVSDVQPLNISSKSWPNSVAKLPRVSKSEQF